MRDIDNLCLNCFEPLADGAVCTNCGYDNDTAAQTMYLMPKTVLANKYVVGAFLSHDSDAVTYMGYDMQLDRPIYIREFYPRGMANRLEGNQDLHIRQKFIDLAVKYKGEFYKLLGMYQAMFEQFYRLRAYADYKGVAVTNLTDESYVDVFEKDTKLFHKKA